MQLFTATNSPPNTPVRTVSTGSDFDSGRNPEPGMALFMSGGWCRAMLCHVGTLWRLYEADLLKGMKRISSVSGGSITAGLLGLHWEKLSSQPNAVRDDFAPKVVAPIRSLASRTIDANSVIGGIFMPGTISQKIAKEYREHLFGDATLQDLPPEGKAPRFVINATNVQSGVLWRFSRPMMGDYRVGQVPNLSVSLATAAAASSAFPPVLSPCELKIEPGQMQILPGNDLHEPPYTTHVYLTDGGVYDNLGLETIWKRYDTILVSDAGGQFDAEPEPKEDWPRHAFRVLNLVDSQMRSIRKRQVIDAYKSKERKAAYWGIRTNIADYQLPTALPCDFTRTTELANTPTRLKRLPSDRQEAADQLGVRPCATPRSGSTCRQQSASLRGGRIPTSCHDPHQHSNYFPKPRSPALPPQSRLLFLRRSMQRNQWQAFALGGVLVALPLVAAHCYFQRDPVIQAAEQRGQFAAYIASLPGYRLKPGDFTVRPGTVVRLSDEGLSVVQWPESAYESGYPFAVQADTSTIDVHATDAVDWSAADELSLPGLAGAAVTSSLKAAGVQRIETEANNVCRWTVSEADLSSAKVKPSIGPISIDSGIGIVQSTIGADSVRYKFFRESNVDAHVKVEAISSLDGSGSSTATSDGILAIARPVFTATLIYTRVPVENAPSPESVAALSQKLQRLGVQVIAGVSGDGLAATLHPDDVRWVREVTTQHIAMDRANLEAMEARNELETTRISLEEATQKVADLRAEFRALPAGGHVEVASSGGSLADELVRLGKERIQIVNRIKDQWSPQQADNLLSGRKLEAMRWAVRKELGDDALELAFHLEAVVAKEDALKQASRH